MGATRLLAQLVTKPVTSPKELRVEAKKWISSLIGATKIVASSGPTTKRMQQALIGSLGEDVMEWVNSEDKKQRGERIPLPKTTPMLNWITSNTI